MSLISNEPIRATDCHCVGAKRQPKAPRLERSIKISVPCRCCQGVGGIREKPIPLRCCGVHLVLVARSRAFSANRSDLTKGACDLTYAEGLTHRAVCVCLVNCHKSPMRLCASNVVGRTPRWLRSFPEVSPTSTLKDGFWVGRGESGRGGVCPA